MPVTNEKTKNEKLTKPSSVSFLFDAIRQYLDDDDLFESCLFYLKGVTGLLGGIFLCNPVLFIRTAFNIFRTIVGLTLGIGFGAGLAIHVLYQLQKWQSEYDKKRQEESKVELRSRRRDSLEKSAVGRILRQKISLSTRTVSDSSGHQFISSVPSIGNAVSAEEKNTYVSLMQEAGYPVHDRILRGQVLREDNEFWNVLYRFTDDRIPLQRGVRLVGDEWPSLPKAVTRELGRFIEHVMRDYVSGWYSNFDPGVLFRTEKEKRDAGIPRDGGGNDEQYDTSRSGSSATVPTESSISATTDGQSRRQSSDGNKISPTHSTPTSKTDKHQDRCSVPRKMVFSTLIHRRAPMIDCCYKMMSSAFGNLATRAEHVNLLELVMIKWTQVLGQYFKVYRTLRHTAQDKKLQKTQMSIRSSDENVPLPVPSEVEVTREFLLAGKLHRAVVFGLDIPSLLFADASGEECGLGPDDVDNDGSNIGTPHPSSDSASEPTHVLESRLYHSNILKECELDYNRVLANRLIRTLMPKSETNSQCVVALVTELIAGSVLTPIMNLWTPSFLNGIIVQIMSTTSGESNDFTSDTSNTDNNNANATATTIDESYFTSGTHYVKEPVKENESYTNTQLEPLPIGLHQQPNKLESSEIKLQDTQEGVLSSSFREIKDDDKHNEIKKIGTEYIILTLLSMALTDLAKFMNFEECRIARQNHEETEVDWDNAECQHSILKLVMAIEAALLDGRCAYLDNNLPVIDNDVVTDNQKESFTELLMNMTSNMDTFDKRIDDFLAQHQTSGPLSNRTCSNFEPDVNEISTIRALISTWLHTGQLFKAIKLICKAADNLLASYYANDAFLSMIDHREAFARQIHILEGVDIMVDTMSILASKRLVLSEEFVLLASAAAITPSSDTNTPKNNSELSDISQYYGRQSTPRYLDFQRNKAFAASLRAERQRRWRSWQTRKMDKEVQAVIRKTASSRECELHSEMHNLARLFHNGTTIMTIRDAARKKEQMNESSRLALDEKVSLLTVEIISSRRRIEVPDDDSSFLLRAQSRPLNPVSIHLDDRNHDMSYKCFHATYEEPAVPQGSTRHSSGRYARRCLLQYYPSDRTALIVLQKDARKLDKRKGNGIANGLGRDQGNDDQISSYFSHTFLRQRYLCQKVAVTQSFLSSSLMESTDFNAFPRTGKALDFVYRMSLFDCPIVDLAGKRFKIQDSASRGVHRADASSFEVSDSSLTYVLLKIGKGYGGKTSNDPGDDKLRDEVGNVETGPDGYPVLFLRFTKSGDQVGTELKPYRLSFVRAALMVTSARQEAQLQSLIECVKAGSAKSATKARTEERLKLVKKILYFANNKADHHNLNQDLKLGHFLDRGQLQRNGLLNLRYPTTILQLQAKVEGTALAKEIPTLSSNSHAPETVLYKIRCTVVVELVDPNESTNELEPYSLDDGSYATVYREEFVVYRSMKEFQIFHKQLKSQVALTESTMSTGNRIVGAATAALSTSSRSLNRRNKKILIPSLAQASKIGSMGITNKSIIKRTELLDEYIGYLLSSNSLMNRCSELLIFLGASHPFPPEVTVTEAKTNVMDSLGRMCFIRSVALNDGTEGSKLRIKSPQKDIKKQFSGSSRRLLVEKAREIEERETIESKSMDPTILNKVDQVPLAEVRNRIVELIRSSFSFEDASFVRSQMLSALETASFVAIAKHSGYRRVLHDQHARHLSGDAIGGWIRTVLDILWPDGVWGTAKPLLTKEEEDALRNEAKVKLHEGFPDQFRKILGKELTADGLDMIHEMLQNKIILKSLLYMLLDLLWIEVFPELRDTLPCASAIDLDLL
mmetsp:Transcript_33093/g.37040  ORF Transcript_33093/g.37040 Transcript_33093/m.37040 type:complete len:1816 (+) Transcript_33093:101-5548(+)